MFDESKPSGFDNEKFTIKPPVQKVEPEKWEKMERMTIEGNIVKRYEFSESDILDYENYYQLIDEVKRGMEPSPEQIQQIFLYGAHIGGNLRGGIAEGAIMRFGDKKGDIYNNCKSLEKIFLNQIYMLEDWRIKESTEHNDNTEYRIWGSYNEKFSILMKKLIRSIDEKTAIDLLCKWKHPCLNPSNYVSIGASYVQLEKEQSEIKKRQETDPIIKEMIKELKKQAKDEIDLITNPEKFSRMYNIPQNRK